MTPGQGLPERLVAFFHANPDEELTLSQVATKFGVSAGRVRNVLATLTKGGVVEDVRVVRLSAKGRA